MDSFEWNKIAGAVLGTLLFVVAVRIASGFIFEVEPPAKPGYVVAGRGGDRRHAAPRQPPSKNPCPIGAPCCPRPMSADGKSISTRCEQCHDLSKGGPEQDRPEPVGRGGPAARLAPGLRLFERHEVEGRHRGPMTSSSSS